MGKYIDIEPLEKDGWMLRRNTFTIDSATVELKHLRDFPTVEISDIITSDNEYMGSVVQGRWIPVTERLPKLYTNVLLSVRQSYAFGEPDNWSVVGQLIDKADITWATNYGFHDLLSSNGKKHTVWVSAWRPLPEPYKGGEEE